MKYEKYPEWGIATFMLTTEDVVAMKKLPPIEKRVRPELLKLLIPQEREVKTKKANKK